MESNNNTMIFNSLWDSMSSIQAIKSRSGTRAKRSENATVIAGMGTSAVRLAKLSDEARMALNDFQNHLRYLNKEDMDEDCFNELLDGMGYVGDRTGLFDSLIDDIAEATGMSCIDAMMKRSVDFDDMVALYSSISYSLQQSNEGPGNALMEFIDKLFDEIVGAGSGELRRGEGKLLIKKLINENASEKYVDELFDKFDTDNSGTINRNELKMGILKINKPDNEGIARGGFNRYLLDPAQTNAKDFVSALEVYAQHHNGATHHLLQNIGCGVFGVHMTGDILLRFLTSYSEFTGSFTSHLKELIAGLEDPRHKEVIQENLTEEMGIYDTETLYKLQHVYGIRRDTVENIPHRDLFQRLLRTLENYLRCSYQSFVPSEIIAPKAEAMEKLSKSTVGLLGALYFGSEVIVPEMYSHILQGLRYSFDLPEEDLVFFTLHIDMDQDHANAMKEIVIDYSKTREDRIELLKATELMLSSRVKFFDGLHKFLPLQKRKPKVPHSLDIAQASTMHRDAPCCLSDFVGRSDMYEMCMPHIDSATVLDIGCGGGAVSRHLKGFGAGTTVGIDLSRSMIEHAIAHKGEEEHYLTGDVCSLVRILEENLSQINLMPSRQNELSCFDLSVAAFLFNHTSLSQMAVIMEQVHSILKPGGHFVFSVPHPFMASIDNEIFGFQHKRSNQYFSLRDNMLEGHTGTVDGTQLKLNMNFKTIGDFFRAIKDNNFEIVDFCEARVTREHMKYSADFFEKVNDVPLNLIIKVRKPEVMPGSLSGEKSSSDIFHEKIRWNNIMCNNFKNSFVVDIPNKVKEELYAAALKCFERGIEVDAFRMGSHVEAVELKCLKLFCTDLAAKLVHETGAVLLRGFDLKRFTHAENNAKLTACGKLAFYILCEHISSVDASTRGRLFDVKSANLDAMGKDADNVLFSVSNSAAGWHTDGASKDKMYDVVGLLCINPAAHGGKFRLSNACNVHDTLRRKLPKFLMYELERPIPRDVLENGAGKGTVGVCVSNKLGRSQSLLFMRIRSNSYPIYALDGDRMRFRYMRHWIETGHDKSNVRLPALLRIAMDILDDELDKECIFHDALKSGEMIFTNNAILPHARDSFEDDPNFPPRHLVRAWMNKLKDVVTKTR